MDFHIFFKIIAAITLEIAVATTLYDEPSPAVPGAGASGSGSAPRLCSCLDLSAHVRSAHWALRFFIQPAIDAARVVLVEAGQRPELLSLLELAQAHGTRLGLCGLRGLVAPRCFVHQRGQLLKKY